MATAGTLTPSPSQPAHQVSRRNTISSFGDVDSSGAYPWPDSPPLRPSPIPDTTSPVYPGRPIRPLPKRRIRDRLSAEHAAQIDYPSAPATSSPIFVYPYNEVEQPQRINLRAASHGDESQCVDCGHDHSDVEVEVGSEGEDEDGRHPTMQFPADSLHITRRDGDYYGNGKLSPADWEAWSKTVAAGSGSSADGYDSFENMSNKKKRKIPQSGVAGHGHHNSLSAEMANMGISQRDGADSDPDDLAEGMATPRTAGNSGTYASHGTSAAYAGASAGASAGKGRTGRSGRGSLDRRPLGASTNGLNATAKVPVGHEQPGIISTAIANAAQNPPTPNQKGQENIKGGVNRPVWPGQSGPSAAYPQPPPPGMKGGYRTGSKPNSSVNVNGAPLPPSQPGPPPPATASAQQGHATPGAQKPTAKPKKQRSPAKMYNIAARERIYQQQYNNYHNPPKREDVWLCEFCEYEAIYGEPPRALIASYEKKDMDERKRLAERRRLLEKAKMKGRKGKKGAKKNSNNNGHNNQNQVASANHQPPANDDIYDDQDDEYYEDEDDDYGAEGQDLSPPPPLQQPPGTYPSELHTHSHDHSHNHVHHSSNGDYIESGTKENWHRRSSP